MAHLTFVGEELAEREPAGVALSPRVPSKYLRAVLEPEPGPLARVRNGIRHRQYHGDRACAARADAKVVQAVLPDAEIAGRRRAATLRRPDLANSNAANQDAMRSIEIVKGQGQFPLGAGIEPGDVIAADVNATAALAVDVRELPACRRPVRGQGCRKRDRDRQQGQRG